MRRYDIVHRMMCGGSRRFLGGGLFALACAYSLAAPDPTPTPTNLSILKELETRIVLDKAKDLQIVVGIQTTDTKEGFTIELDRGKIRVEAGLPERAAAVISGRRSSIARIIRGQETLSGAVRRNLVDVQGDINKVFEILDCCIRRRPTPAPTAPTR